jgi:hypothetical protein
MNISSIQSLIQKIEPTVTKHTSSSFLQIMDKSVSYLGAWTLYILGAACIGFIFIMSSIFPFHVMSKIEYTDAVIAAIGSKGDAQAFVLAIRSLVGLIGILLILWGRNLSKMIAHKNALSETALALKETLVSLKKEEQVLIKSDPKQIKLDNGATLKEREAKDIPFLDVE